MKSNPPARPAEPSTSRHHPLVLACVAFVLGIALTGIWFHHHHSGAKNSGLSASTRLLLEHLEAPVTIRYYSLLPAGSSEETVRTFAGRVTRLLNAMQAASGGKVQFSSFDTPSETNTAAATADGMQAFNLDKGDACFMGISITSGKSRETFSRLQPEWEEALEYDLARAISRVVATVAPAPLAPEVAKPSPAIIASINRLIPDVNAVSVEEADRIFHADFLKQCGEVGTEVEAQIKVAQQQVIQAQTSGSQADLEAAQKNLTQVQLTQADKLKEIAAQLPVRLAVFQRMKASPTNNTK